MGRLQAVRGSRAYAAIPHDLAEDHRLTPLDLAVVRVLLKYARNLDRCWVLVAIIAAAVRRGRRSVQLSLRRLEASGWLATEPAPNRSGRAFVLTWRVDAPEVVAPAVVAPPPPEPIAPPEAQPMAHPEAQPIAPKEDVGVQRESGTEQEAVERPRRDFRAELVAMPASDPVIAREQARMAAARARPAPAPLPPATFEELIARVRERPDHPIQLADALASAFGDRKSFAGYHARCREAWAGLLEPEDLAEAYRIARKPGARNPGAIFMGVLKRARRPSPRC